MPGRFLANAADVKRPAVRDPVPTSHAVHAAMYALCIFALYGTWYVGEYYIPTGSSARAARGNRGGSFATLKVMKDYFTAAIPWFFFLMFAEFVIIRVTKLKSIGADYHAVDTWASLATGFSQSTVTMLVKPFWPTTWVYCWLWDTFGVTHGFMTDDSWLTAVACFVAGDFAYYWFHRNAHEVAWMWAGHHVHHASERYNLSTALRQSWQQALMSGCWSWPLAFFLPPHAYVLAQQWVTLYQFWVHTCVVRRMHWVFEYLFVTPSHHRIHHDRRVHKNFAGVFIIWDRIFGTFHDELLDAMPTPGEEPTPNEELCYFGIQDRIASWGDSATQFQLAKKCVRGSTFKQKLLSLWIGPGWSTTTARRPLPTKAPASVLRIRLDTSKIADVVKAYVFLSLLINVQFLVTVLLVAGKEAWSDLFFTNCFLLLTLTAHGLLFDRSPTGFVIEVLRCVLGVVAASAFPFDYMAEVHLACLVVLVVFHQKFLPQ